MAWSVMLDFIVGISWPLLVLSCFCYIRKELTSLLQNLALLLNKAHQKGVEIDSPVIGKVKIKGNNKKPNKSV